VAAGANERGSFFVSEGIPGGRPLDEVLAAGLPSRRGRCALIRLLAGMAAALHGHNLFHRDFYLCHVFVVGGEEEAFELKLIDLQRVLSPRLLRRRWMVKDLASLHYSCARGWATAADRARFLSFYLDSLGAGPLDRNRRFARAVLRKAARIARHNRPREA
jgi:heptose I phosphotransferase